MTGESYELLFEIKQRGQTALTEIENDIRKVDTAGKSAGASIDKVADSSSKAAGAASSLRATIASLLSAIQQNTGANRELTSSLDSVSTSSGGAAAGLRSVGNAAHGMVPEVAAASAALRTFEGAMPIRAAERFLTNVLGLGPILRVAFPVVGAIAFVEVIGQMVGKVGDLYNAWNPVVRAEQSALAAIKESVKEYENLNREAQKFKDDAFEREHGRVALLRMQANRATQDAKYGDGSGFGDVGSIPALTANIAKIDAALAHLELDRATHTSSQADPRLPLITRPRTPGKNDLTATTLGGDDIREYRPQALADYRSAFQEELEVARKRQQVSGLDASDKTAQADKIERDKRAEEARKAAGEIASAEKSAAGVLREAQTFELTGLTKIIVKRQELLELYGKSSKAINDLNQAFGIEFTREVGKESQKNAADIVKALEREQESSSKLSAEQFQKALKEKISAAEKNIRDLDAALDRLDRVDANQVKRAGDKALRIAELTAGPGGERQAAESAYQVRLSLAEKLFEIEKRRLDRLSDEGEKDKALADARLQYEDELDQARTEHEIKLLELQKKSIDEARNLAGSLYDAIRGGGNGVQKFFQGQFNSLGRQVFTNATSGLIQSGERTLGNLIPGQLGANGKPTLLGTLLAGTMLDSRSASPEITSRDNNTKAIDGLTAALTGTSTGDLAKFGSDTNGITGSGGLKGLPPGLSKLLGLGSSGVISDFVGGLPRFAQEGQGPMAVYDAITGLSGDSTAQRIGVVAGAGGAAALGTLGVISGIKTGGARGITSAVGSAAATAAAFDPEPISKGILASVALVSGIVKGLFGDPRQHRDEEETRMLRNQQYFAPPTIDRTTNLAGNEIGYDKFGRPRSLPFQTFSELMPYDKRYHIPGKEGFWQQVPGQILEPYDSTQSVGKDFSLPNGNPLAGVGAPPQTIQYITIQAIDSQSVEQFFQKNSSLTAGAVSKEIKLGHPVGLAVQQAVFGT